MPILGSVHHKCTQGTVAGHAVIGGSHLLAMHEVSSVTVIPLVALMAENVERAVHIYYV